MNQKRNHREHEDQMNRPARHVKGNETEDPGDQENHSECQQHDNPSFVRTKSTFHARSSPARDSLGTLGTAFGHALRKSGLQRRKRAILLVEDDGDLREAVAPILVNDGFLVVRAANGSEALGILARSDSFLRVLLHARMPVMNGLEFRRRQVLDPGIAEVPVIAFSAEKDRAAMAALGIDLFLPKPVRVLDLIAMIDGLCTRSSEEALLRTA